MSQLLPEEMDQYIAAGTFRLAFVGLSNAGKSYRSKVLVEQADFYWYEVDSSIQNELGLEDMSDISGWLGYPTTTTYKERAAKYLAAEEKCTHLASLDTKGKNLVFDTTGSVIHLTGETKDWLLDQCLVVNIDVGEDSITELCDKYFEEPKPVLWGDSFNQQEGETDEESLRRCYPEMLRDRLGKYRELAHVSISMVDLFDRSAEETLTTIKASLG